MYVLPEQKLNRNRNVHCYSVCPTCIKPNVSGLCLYCVFCDAYFAFHNFPITNQSPIEIHKPITLVCVISPSDVVMIINECSPAAVRYDFVSLAN